MMRNKFRKIIYVLFILIALSVFVFSVSEIVKYKYNEEKQREVIEKIQNERQEVQSEEKVIPVKVEEVEEQSEPDEPIEKEMLEEYTKLYEENSDMYGWIKIDGTIVDFPVMYTPQEPNFYIDKDWNKEYCYNGVGTSIWIDGRTTEDSENIIVYGHHLKSGEMFGNLKAYKDRDYYEEHQYIDFDTLYEKQRFEIISVSKAVVYYDKVPEDVYLFYEHVELDSEEEFDSYVRNVKQNAWYDIDVTAEYGDQLITLCTCDYWTRNARLIIVAKRV